MKIYLPYTEIQEATLISLIGYDYIKVETSVKDDFSYWKYWKQRWKEKETFINIEQDAIIWPGAIESLVNCPEEWCAYDHSAANWGIIAPNSIPIICVKITDRLIKKLPHCWDEPTDFRTCDISLSKQAFKVGLKVHQHFPGIVNANRMLLLN